MITRFCFGTGNCNYPADLFTNKKLVNTFKFDIFQVGNMQDLNAASKDSAGAAATAGKSVTLGYWDKVKRAARDNKPDVLKELMKEDVNYDEKGYTSYFPREKPEAGEFGWTALHYAAFLGHTECVRILLNEKRYLMDVEAVDGSTALMVACANLPTSKQCIKVLCEYGANRYKYTKPDDDDDTALTIALWRQPDLEVVKWLVSGADMKKLMFDEIGQSGAMMDIWFEPDDPTDLPTRRVKFPSDLETEDENYRPEESAIAEIAMHLADHGCVKGALLGLLQSSSSLTPQLTNEVVECFLKNGAVMDVELKDKEELEEAMDTKCKPRLLSLFAKKSLIYLEGISRSSKAFMPKSPYFQPIYISNALALLLLRGQACGTLPLADVKEMHDVLKSDYGDFLPNIFPVETLYDMTKNPPSLKQLARTKIRAQMAESGKFSRENFKELPDLPKVMVHFLQLDDLGDGKEIEEIVNKFDQDEEDENEEEEDEQDEE